MQSTPILNLVFMLTSILAGSTDVNMDWDIRDWFNKIIEIGFEHKINEELPRLVMHNYGQMIEEVFKSITTANYCPSLEYFATRGIVNSISLRKFISAVMEKKLIPSYKVKLDENQYRPSTSIIVKISKYSYDDETVLSIGSTLKAYECSTDCDVTLDGINEFRRSIIFLQLLLVLCNDHDGLEKLKTLTLNVEHDGYGVTNWVPRWIMSSVIDTYTESWNLVTKAVEDLTYAPWLDASYQESAHGKEYSALELDNTTLFDDIQAVVGASDSSDSDNEDNDDDNDDQ